MRDQRSPNFSHFSHFTLFAFIQAKPKNSDLAKGPDFSKYNNLLPYRIWLSTHKSITIRHSGSLLAGIHNPAWYEFHGSIESAIQQEKRLKDGKRKWKYLLIERMNANWEDLYHAII